MIKFEKNFYKENEVVRDRQSSVIQEFCRKNKITVRSLTNQKVPNPIFEFKEMDLPRRI